MLNLLTRFMLGLALITGLSACPVGEDNEGGGIGNLGERGEDGERRGDRDGDEGDD